MQVFLAWRLPEEQLSSGAGINTEGPGGQLSSGAGINTEGSIGQLSSGAGENIEGSRGQLSLGAGINIRGPGGRLSSGANRIVGALECSMAHELIPRPIRRGPQELIAERAVQLRS